MLQLGLSKAIPRCTVIYFRCETGHTNNYLLGHRRQQLLTRRWGIKHSSSFTEKQGVVYSFILSLFLHSALFALTASSTSKATAGITFCYMRHKKRRKINYNRQLDEERPALSITTAQGSSNYSRGGAAKCTSMLTTTGVILIPLSYHRAQESHA